MSTPQLPAPTLTDRVRWIWLVAAMTFLGSAAGGEVAQQFSHEIDPADSGVNQAAIVEMDRLLQSMVDDRKVSSVVGFVARDGNVIYDKAFGWKDVENQVPATVNDYYVLFSQTKAITTVAFMTLVEQGLVNIDDPVAEYFPEIPDEVVTRVNEDGTYETRPAKSPMTFVHLMSHTSGLGAGLVREIAIARGAGGGPPVGFGGQEPERAPIGQRSGGGNLDAKFLEEEMLALAEYPLGFDPGTRWNYHVSTNMLAYMVERISGQPLREYLKETILDPLGMVETDWYYAPEALHRFVKAYSWVDGELVPGSDWYLRGTISREQTYAEGAIGLNGPIEDYARFCQMLLNGGVFNGHRILEKETIDLMTTVNRLQGVEGAEPEFQFGLGFELHKGKKPVPAVSGSAFSWGGMLGTQYLVDPDHDMISLFYINMYRRDNLYPLFQAQAYRLFEPTSDPGTRPTLTLEEGGQGPFPAIVTEDPTLPGITIYRPEDLSPFVDDNNLPILLWGNGGCVNTTKEHRFFLNEIASHGYIVLGSGLFDRLDFHDEVSTQKTSSMQLTGALDWILAQNETASSPYFGKVNAEAVAAAGSSCGGLQAIEISSDPRIRTAVVANSGVLREPSPMPGMPSITKEALLDYHGPVLYLMGGPSDIAYENGMDDFNRVNHVPIVMTNLDVGHGGTFGQPHGGRYAPVTIAWLDWHLKEREEASRMFVGENSLLAVDPDWSIALKNFQE